MIKLELNTIYGWLPCWFLVDTGADFTMVPESLAEFVGVELDRCPREHAVGIEGRPVPARVGSITIRIGPEVVLVRCHFLEAVRAPYLLGRMDLFSRFSIFFHNDHRQISFTRFK